MSKETDKGVKIELGPNTDFSNLVALSLGKAQMDPDLTKEQKKALTKITPIESRILVRAIEDAAQDGLYEHEIDGIFGDVNDLIKHGCNAKNFDKMIQNPENAKYELTPSVIKILKILTAEEKSSLKHDLHSQGPKVLDRLKDFFEKALEVLLPIVKTLMVEASLLGAKQLTPLIEKNIGGDWAKLLTKVVNDTATEVKKIKLSDDDAMAIVTEHVTVTQTTTHHPDVLVAGDHVVHTDAV